MVACADAGAYLISPFVGRFTDWHMKVEGVTDYPQESDQGVLSFRNVDQIKSLAGCDNLTIAPKLLEELPSDTVELP